MTLAHEALLTQWRRLRGWLEALRDDRLLAEELERAAERWARERDDTLLWRKRGLAAAEDLARLGLVRLSLAAAELVRRTRGAARPFERWIPRRAHRAPDGPAHGAPGRPGAPGPGFRGLAARAG